MTILDIIKLLGGLAFFMYGMTVLSEALRKTAGGKLEKLLRKATDNPFKGLAIGAVITIAIQSSSAMTVMLVGFVNSGIMDLGQTIGVIFGSDIGTTLTAWILSLSGIESDNIFISLLSPKNFCLIFALIGIILLMVCKQQRKKDIGQMLLGFAVLMTGMTMMSSSMEPLREMEEFTQLLTAFNNPLLGVLAGTLVTGVIQSSAASIGILQSMSLTGQITWAMAIPIIMGANIGTCATAILSSFGVNRNAKRVTVIHVAVKVIGTIIWLIAFYGLYAIFHFPFMSKTINIFGIAIFHTIFNVVNTIIFFPFQKQLEKLSRIIVKDKEEDQEFVLDERIMLTPPIAINECSIMMGKMVNRVESGLDKATNMLVDGYNKDDFEEIIKNEEKIDGYEDHIGSFLMKLTTSQHLSEQDKNKSSKMLQAIGEFERIGDHASYMAKSAEELKLKNINFSPVAQEELRQIIAAVQEVYRMAINCYRSEETDGAMYIAQLRIVISEMCDAFKATHVERLSEGICTAEQGFVFNDVLYSCGRIADHATNVAAIVYRFTSDNRVRGSYMHDFKQRKDIASEAAYQMYLNKYMPKRLIKN